MNNGNLKDFVDSDLFEVLELNNIPIEIKYGTLTIAGYNEISIKDEKEIIKYIKALNSLRVIEKIEEPFISSPDTGSFFIFIFENKEIEINVNEIDEVLIIGDDIYSIENYWKLLKLRD